MEALVMGILLDMIFFARFLYIKTQFYKTKGVANGNDRRYTSEFIYGYRGHNYVCSVTNNIICWFIHSAIVIVVYRGTLGSGKIR